MKPELQRIKVEPAILDDDDFAVENTAGRQVRPQRLEQFRKVTVQRFFIAALDEDLISVAKNQGAKPIPLGLENPVSASRQFANSLGEHRQDRRVHGKIHAFCYTAQRVVQVRIGYRQERYNT